VNVTPALLRDVRVGRDRDDEQIAEGLRLLEMH